MQRNKKERVEVPRNMKLKLLFIQNKFLLKSLISHSIAHTHANAQLVHSAKCLLLFNFRYTWNGKNSQYPMIKTIRYPRYKTPNPNVTCYVVNLNVLKYINLIPLVLPQHLIGDFYIGNMAWINNQELTLTYTSRDQTLSSSVLCKAPLFECFEVSWIRNSFVFWGFVSR